MNLMVDRDQVPLLLGIGAVVVTLGVGTCSTNARIDDLGDNMNSRFDDMNNRFEDMNSRFDDVNRRIDGVQADVRELRGLFFESIKGDAPAN